MGDLLGYPLALKVLRCGQYVGGEGGEDGGWTCDVLIKDLGEEVSHGIKSKATVDQRWGRCRHSGRSLASNPGYCS